ncbi:MAG TPA: type II toxin-antitoxin system RelE/ParE family toxin [Longimicrobium sp.]|nr:type II toxin-antitoxin system RelE/ParE family toxin [Longimicrobium sp.]
MRSQPKPLEFVASSRRDLRGFPQTAREAAGRELRRVQWDRLPKDWKPMNGVGPGACEIRVRSSEGGTVQHRVLYVAKFDEAVYVLHAFEKKTRETPRFLLEVAAARYKQMLRERDDGET